MSEGRFALTETERRRRRERIFRWLAALHSGPLGMAMAGYPELARAYDEVYARCPGCPALACRVSGGVPRVCLPRRLEALAESARRGGPGRRRREEVWIAELQTCLTFLEREKPEFAPIWRLTREKLAEARRL